MLVQIAGPLFPVEIIVLEDFDCVKHFYKPVAIFVLPRESRIEVFELMVVAFLVV